MTGGLRGLLEGKVVVISGVGPALGTTLARRCAENGADLVLAARTVERLDDVAKQVTDMGRRAVSIGTDITDEDQVMASSEVIQSLRHAGANFNRMFGDGPGNCSYGLMQRWSNRFNRQPLECLGQGMSETMQPIAMTDDAIAFNVINHCSDLGGRVLFMIKK